VFGVGGISSVDECNVRTNLPADDASIRSRRSVFGDSPVRGSGYIGRLSAGSKRANENTRRRNERNGFTGRRVGADIRVRRRRNRIRLDVFSGSPDGEIYYRFAEFIGYR